MFHLCLEIGIQFAARTLILRFHCVLLAVENVTPIVILAARILTATADIGAWPVVIEIAGRGYVPLKSSIITKINTAWTFNLWFHRLPNT